MNDTLGDAFRQRLDRALDRLGLARPTRPLQPVPAGAGARRPLPTARRPMRPVRGRARMPLI